MNTRRTFIQSLAAIPLLGWAFASARPATETLPAEPVYGFDERLTLKDLYGDHRFIAGEDLERGDFVALGKDGNLFRVGLDDRPCGLATARVMAGTEVQDTILVQGSPPAGIAGE